MEALGNVRSFKMIQNSKLYLDIFTIKIQKYPSCVDFCISLLPLKPQKTSAEICSPKLAPRYTYPPLPSLSLATVKFNFLILCMIINFKHVVFMSFVYKERNCEKKNMFYMVVARKGRKRPIYKSAFVQILIMFQSLNQTTHSNLEASHSKCKFIHYSQWK